MPHATLDSIFTLKQAFLSIMEEPTFHMPAEWEPHAATIMTWPTSESILDEDWAYPGANVEATYSELTQIIRAISQFEPVHIFIKDPKHHPYPNPKHSSGYTPSQHHLSRLPNTHLHTTRNTDSLWSRDNGAVYIRSSAPLTNTYHPTDNPGPGFSRHPLSSRRIALLLSFNQWGKSFTPSPDSYLAQTSAQTLSIPSLLAPFISEGGSIEVDGRGTLLITESSVLNCNRNPGLSKGRLEGYFREFLGVDKTVWLRGERGGDVTDGHVDCLARFTEVEGVVLVSRRWGKRDEVFEEARETIEGSTDARGRKLRVVEVREPDPRVVLGKDYRVEAGPCVSYVNFQIVNGGVVMAKFGDEVRDEEARKLVAQYFPSRKVVQVHLRQLALQGGGIHCATKQVIEE